MATEQLARARLPTSYGVFDAHAYESPTGLVYLALTHGDFTDGRSVLTRVHSGCLTGDALGSLRCDCGIQLRWALRAIAAEDQGVLVYAAGHEGRGIGLMNKLRAYFEQDRGLDTVDANTHLGLPIDGRDYLETARILARLGVRSVRLITNNPGKAAGLRAGGIQVEEVRGFPVAAQSETVAYLRTKQDRMGHTSPLGEALEPEVATPSDVTELFGRVRARPDRPYVVVKFAQSLDGRIATAARDSKWISGEPERRVAHSLRALCDAVLVGAGTIVTDDPLLTVRLVPGASPLRVVFDTTLRIPLDARVLNDDARTLVITTERADPRAARALRASHIGVREVKSTPSGVDPGAALRLLRESGVSSLLVEGGSRMITSLLGAEAVDRLIVSVAPKVLGQGVDAVGDLGVLKVSKAVSLVDRSVHLIGEDVVLAWDVAPPVATSTTRPAALLARGWPGRGDRSDGSRAGG